VLCLCAWSLAARADGYLHELAHAVDARLDAVIAARVPQLVPPVPVVVHWKVQKLGAVDLGAPLVAFVAADLDGDGKGELYAVTPREVVVLAAREKEHGVRELGRAAFGGELAVPASRDPVGGAVQDGDAVVAAVSTWQRGLRVQLRGGHVTSVPDPIAGVPLCARRLMLVPGRNYYLDGGEALFGARCRELIDATGHTMHAAATLATSGLLAVVVGGQRHDFDKVGVAFDLADVDRDGVPEVIVSGATAPGDPDAVKVFAFAGDDKKPEFRKAFNGGVVGVAAVDLDGDGALEVVVAVRLVGSTKVDLWRLN
jgi:hypothetical protein